MSEKTVATPAEHFFQAPLFATQGTVAACRHCWLNIHRDSIRGPWVHDRNGRPECGKPLLEVLADGQDETRAHYRASARDAGPDESRREDTAMTDEYTCNGWCCVDCLIELANGEAPADLTEEELTAREEDIARRNAGYNITLGMLREDHSCTDENGQTAGDRGGECDCETNTFSWSACDVCGSNLGGERHAVSFWRIKA